MRRQVNTITLSVSLLLVLAESTQAGQIVGVSIPVNSMDSSCFPLNDDLWSVSAPPYPLDTTLGIGALIHPDWFWQGAFSLHDHYYLSSNVPDPARAVVTYEFDTAVVVDQIEVLQHNNGITRMECFVGDDLASMTSIGSIFGPSGDVTGSGVFAEGASYVFDFNNVMDGRFLQLIVRKTSNPAGWASYQIYPRDAAGVRFAAAVPEPATLSLLAVGLTSLAMRRRRTQ